MMQLPVASFQLPAVVSFELKAAEDWWLAADAKY